jgi:hypothetical protein
MRKRRAFATVLFGALFLATTLVQAHHSFSAVYDGNKPITLKGVVSKLGWSNPHAFIYIDVKNPNGEVVTWEIESAGASTLLRAGIRREDFIGNGGYRQGFSRQGRDARGQRCQLHHRRIQQRVRQRGNPEAVDPLLRQGVDRWTEWRLRWL